MRGWPTLPLACVPYTHSWPCRTHRSERLLFCSRVTKVTCLCAEEPLHSCWRVNTSSSEGFTGMQSFLSRTNTRTRLIISSWVPVCKSLNHNCWNWPRWCCNTVALPEDCFLLIVSLFYFSMTLNHSRRPEFKFLFPFCCRKPRFTGLRPPVEAFPAVKVRADGTPWGQYENVSSGGYYLPCNIPPALMSLLMFFPSVCRFHGVLQPQYARLQELLLDEAWSGYKY